MAKFFKYLTLTLLALVGLIVAAFYFLDFNRFKPLIENEFNARTGVPLHIDGTISPTFYPWLGMSLNEVRIGNPQGFKAPYFAKMRALKVQMKLLPLLNKRLEIDEIAIETPEVFLEKNRFNQGNWQALQTAKIAKTSTAAKDAHRPIQFQSLNGIEINNGLIHWINAADDKNIDIFLPKFKTDAIAADRTTNISLQTHFKLPQSSTTLQLNITGKSTPTSDWQAIHTQDLRIDAKYTEPDTQPLSVAVKGDLKMHLGTGKSTMQPLQITLPDAVGDGELTYQSNDSALTFRLAFSKLNWDTLRAASHTQALFETLPKATQALAQSTHTPPVHLAANTDKPLSIKGSILIDQLTAYGLALNKTQLELLQTPAVRRLNLNIQDVYQGHYQGHIEWPLQTQSAQFNSEHHVEGVQLEPLLSALKSTWRATGTLNGRTTLTDTLSGQFQFNLTEGVIYGFDLPQLIDTIKERKLPVQYPLNQEALTPFTNLSAEGSLSQDVVHLQSIVLNSVRLNAQGDGRVLLPQESLDILLNVSLQKADGTPEGRFTQIPLKIEGKWSSPKFSLDLQRLVTEELKEKLQEKYQKFEDKLQEKLQDKLRNILGR